MLWMMAALAAEPVALVELFTSQGCSSCPPADAFVQGLDLDARRDGLAVYVLSYHVDYWDRLGWKDPYGDARWTGRQRDYARAFRSEKLYTPQIVVNGELEGVGSNAPRIKGYIAHALTRDSTARIEGHARVEGRTVKVEVTTVGAPLGGQIYVAVIEPQRSNTVDAGENRGHRSVHTNVVRAMVKADAPGSTGSITVPDDVDLTKLEVLAWVADPLTLHVVGAGKLDRR